jgi:hypothetical protein
MKNIAHFAGTPPGQGAMLRRHKPSKKKPAAAVKLRRGLLFRLDYFLVNLLIALSNTITCNAIVAMRKIFFKRSPPF